MVTKYNHKTKNIKVLKKICILNTSSLIVLLLLHYEIFTR